MPVNIGEIGRQVKQKSGSLECYDLTVHGTLTLSQGKIKLLNPQGRLSNPDLVIVDNDDAELARLTFAEGNWKIRGQPLKI